MLAGTQGTPQVPLQQHHKHTRKVSEMQAKSDDGRLEKCPGLDVRRRKELGFGEPLTTLHSKPEVLLAAILTRIGIFEQASLGRIWGAETVRWTLDGSGYGSRTDNDECFLAATGATRLSASIIEVESRCVLWYTKAWTYHPTSHVASTTRRGRITEDGMLVLSRNTEQTIMIGDDVEIKVVDIRGGKVRLGITAPQSVSVHRREVYDRIERERQKDDRVGKTGPHAD